MSDKEIEYIRAWITHLSHCLRVHEAIIHSETIKTNNTVPGHIVINVFKTNLRKRRITKSLITYKSVPLHSPCIKINAIQCTYAPGGGVGEQLGVQQHDATDQVQPQEHWQ